MRSEVPANGGVPVEWGKLNAGVGVKLAVTRSGNVVVAVSSSLLPNLQDCCTTAAILRSRASINPTLDGENAAQVYT